jgi:competence protein ComEA
MKSFLNIVIGILIGLLATGIIIITTSPQRGEPVTLLSTSTSGKITVYVSGAVATPGVYVLPEGSRVDNAIQAAGGFITGSEKERVNLAALIIDGEQIDVPGLSSTNRINAGRVNINTASASELDALPGIGPSTAQAIVDYRIQNGSFQTIQAIQLVPGIGPVTFNGIQDYITIGP